MAESVNGAQEYIRERMMQLQSGEMPDDVSNKKNVKEDAAYIMMFDDIQKFVVKEKLPELTSAIEKNDSTVLSNIVSVYISEHYPNYAINEKLFHETTNRIVSDMTGFAFLNEYFARSEEIEEININGWDSVVVTWLNGKKELTKDHFYSPEHAKDIMMRILRQTGRYLDEQKVYDVTYLGKNIRIATAITPLVDPEIGVSASIRFIHPAVYTMEKLTEVETLTPKMASALRTFLNYGVSVCICGSTGSGKTTICNAVLEGVAPMKRVVTLEGGTREYELVRRDENGNIQNDRLHLQTRPHREAALNVDLQTLLDLVLKFDPEIITVGEMVSEEAFIASEAARTSHTVITTIHASNAREAYFRMYSLGLRKYDLQPELMTKFMVDAFPIIVSVKKFPDGIRRIQSILEGEYDTTTKTIMYNELFRFEVDDNIRRADGTTETVGKFKQVGEPSDKLVAIMMDNGATRAEVNALATE